ncbi:MAG: hypothetical protein A2Y86_02435 [Candidatus Aminicenantes bacterium RBG_13_62_12]|nr:MAG: hypothetical protein A2Y86_02435 [Candidatus Aminicenantes bacterium RBG_13_62_12]
MTSGLEAAARERIVSVEARVMASLWDRNRLVCSVTDRSSFLPLFRWLRIYIPRYRQLLLLGDVPKEVLHLKGVRFLEGDDLKSQRAALELSFSDEETGAPPIQVIGFGLGEDAFQALLGRLDRGWVAFFQGLTRERLEASGHPVREEIALEGGSLYLLDPLPSDLSPEEELLLETASCSPAMKDFMIQMRQSQVYLAFQAIIAELESGRPITRSYLSETLRVKEKTLKKILRIGLRERRLDLVPYIKDTPRRVIEFLQGLSRESNLALVALFDGEQLVGYARYRECFFPSRSFLAFKRELDKIAGTTCNPGRSWCLEMRAGDKTALVFRGRYLCGFLLESTTESDAFRSRVARGIAFLEKKVAVKPGGLMLTAGK